jgi:hypothetical protein
VILPVKEAKVAREAIGARSHDAYWTAESHPDKPRIWVPIMREDHVRACVAMLERFKDQKLRRSWSRERIDYWLIVFGDELRFRARQPGGS